MRVLSIFLLQKTAVYVATDEWYDIAVKGENQEKIPDSLKRYLAWPRCMNYLDQGSR